METSSGRKVRAPVYVISLVRLRRNLWVFLRILVVLIVIGLVLPRIIAAVSQRVTPGAGWLTAAVNAVKGWSVAAADTVKGWFRDAVAAVSEWMDPFVETLKQYYKGK